MDISTVPDDVLQNIASGNSQSSSPQPPGQQDLSSVPDDVLQNIASGKNNLQLPDVFNGEQGDGQQSQSQTQQQDQLNLGDHAALSFLNSPQDQQNYLKTKFPYVVPDGKGNYMVGKTPGTSQLVNPSGSGNGFFSWLASQSDQILPTAGMIVGAAEGPVGAGAGAMAGEALNKVISSAMGANESPLKMGVDTAISGAFGAVGQKAADMFGLAAGKVIAPPLAKLVDGKLTQIVNKGGDPSKFINFVSKAVHFASGADAEDVKTLMQYGVNKSLSDPAVNNKNAIINIAQDIVDATQSKRNQLGQAVWGVKGASRALLQKAGNEDVPMSGIHSYLKQEMESHPGWGTVEGNVITLNKQAVNPQDSAKFGQLLDKLGATPIRTKYEAPQTSQMLRMAQDQADNLQYDINNPQHQGFIEKTLGLKSGSISNELEKFATAKQNFSTGGPQAFKIPENGKISVRQAIGVKQDFGGLTDKKDSPLSDDMRRVFTNVLTNHDESIGKSLSKVASQKGVNEYVAANQAYSSFMKSVETVQKNGLDPYEPKSIQDYGKHINDRPPVDSQALNTFENNVGSPVLDNLRRYSAIQKLSNYSPNFLRLGLISGALGSMLGDGDFEQRIGRGAFFALGIPAALKTSLRATELPQMAGGAILRGLVKSAPAVGSQAGAKVLQNLINNKNNNK